MSVMNALGLNNDTISNGGGSPTLSAIQNSKQQEEQRNKPKSTEDKSKQEQQKPKEDTKAADNKSGDTKDNTQKDNNGILPDIDFSNLGFDNSFAEKWEKLGKSLKDKFVVKKRGDRTIEDALQARRSGNAFQELRKKLESYAIKSAVWGIGGMPATYLDNTDPPLPSAQDGLGYQYISTVIRYGTFIAFQPGYITWKISLGMLDKDNILNPANITYLQKMVISGSLDFNQPKLKEYWLEVGRHCRLAILLMGIEDLGLEAAFFGTKSRSPAYGGGLNISEPKLSSLSFNKFGHTDLANLGIGLADAVIQGIPIAAHSTVDTKGGEDQSSGFVVFYTDGPIEASDQFTNNSEPSAFKSAFDELMGDTSSVIREVMGKTLGGDGVGGNTLLTFLGGAAIIPDAWKDSQYPKQYSFNIKLVSASGDPVSVFMNVIYPLIKLLCLTVPLGTGGFYSSAPILRVFSQGVINTEYGLIETLSINRKMETLNDWGMPTEVDVSITLRDLNAYLYREMPGWFESGMTTGASMTTFLATICGMNVTTLNHGQKMNIDEKMYNAYMANEGTFKNIMDRKFQGWADMAENGIYRLQDKAQSVRLGAARTWNLLTTAPRDIMDRTKSIGKTITTGVDRRVTAGTRAMQGDYSKPR